jgi:O-antigen/teichoic acid export membrane protein
MNNRSRIFNSIRNIAVSTLIQVLTLILSFISRTLFIKYLGSEYLGINGLYTNILSVLSLAELGMGTSIIYALYKPLAENNTEKLAELMNFYKTAYRVIALIVATVGSALIPFLSFFIKTDSVIPHFRLYYILFLANSVCSYLFIYKSSIINADQRYYITKTNTFIFDLLRNVLQIVLLILTHNYILYLVIQIICTLGGNISIAIKANKRYPFLKNKKAKLPSDEKHKIFDNIKSVFVYKLGGVILNNTDNILISKIIGTICVGLYSNYILVVNAIETFTTLLFSSMTGSIGNLNATSSRKESLDVFESLNFMRFWIFGFCSIAFLSLLDSFVVLWLSTDYRLEHIVIVAIAFNVYVKGMSFSTSDFRDTTGMFRQTKYIFLFTAALNLILSIILGLKIGLSGILFATGISRILTNVWYEPVVMYKQYFKQSSVKYFMRQILYFILTFVAYIPVYFFNKLIPEVTFVHFIYRVIFTAIVPNVIFLLATFKLKEFQYLKDKIKLIFSKKLRNYHE